MSTNDDENNGDAPEPTIDELRAAAGDLVEHEDVLSQVRDTLDAVGFAGDTRAVELTWLAAVSRLLPTPVSTIARGQSAAGKSCTIKQALAFIPPEDQIVLTGMSEKALMYMDADFSHKLLVIFEAQGLGADFVSYVIRSLLSEGRVEYIYTDFERRQSVRISKQGPTALVSSTAGRVDFELGTRVLAPNVEDTPELTRAIMLSQAAAAEGRERDADYARFHAHQRLIAAGTRLVRVPFASQLAEKAEARAVRMRRDFSAILTLIQAHALVHQAQRVRDGDHIVARVADYVAVHRLVAQTLAESAERTVPQPVRETVDAVFKLQSPAAAGFGEPPGLRPVHIRAVADELGITRSSASRRLSRAVSLGYVRDLNAGRGGAKTFETADHMPADNPVLPDPAEIPDANA